MAAYLLKQSQKLLTTISDAQIKNTCTITYKAFSILKISNHVRLSPFKNKKIGIKHGSIPLEDKVKAILATIAHTQIISELQYVTRNIFYTKNQDTTCQHINRIIKKASTRSFHMF